MGTVWNGVILFFAIFGGIAFVIFFCGFFDDRKQIKEKKEVRASLLEDRVSILEMGRQTLFLDVKQEVKGLGLRFDRLQKVLDLLEKTAVLKENRYINKPRSYGSRIYYGVPYDLASEEQAVTQMQEQREKAIRDGFTLIHTHSDGSETWIKKDKKVKSS